MRGRVHAARRTADDDAPGRPTARVAARHRETRAPGANHDGHRGCDKRGIAPDQKITGDRELLSRWCRIGVARGPFPSELEQRLRRDRDVDAADPLRLAKKLATA
jgi:hypothetical protein